MYPRACLALLMLGAIGCNAVESSSTPQSLQAIAKDLFVSQPTIGPNPIERAPLIAIIEFQSPVDVIPSLIISDGEREWEQPWRVSAARKHRIAALGLRPDRKHSIRVRATVPESDQSQLSEPLEFQTPPLPESFPPLHVVRAEPEKMEPGVTLFAVNIWRDSVSILDYGYIIALDARGDVVWYCHTADRIADMRILKNGNIVYQHGNYRYVYEIDIMGRDIRRWVGTNLTQLPTEDSIPIEIDTTHHDMLELPNGNFMTLATELQHFNQFPTSEFDADAPWEPADVVCDTIVEFDSKTGKIVERFHLTDILDRRRFGYISLGSFWKDKYNDDGTISRDWSHANALSYVPDEDAVIVSSRHLDFIMKLDWKTKKIRWIFGDPSGWSEPWHKYLLKQKGEEFGWCYHAHSPQLTPRGTLMVYDNGNYRARPFDQATPAIQNRSRVVEFRIDEEAMTVEKIFEYDGGKEDRFYCPFYCEADWLPKTQNILVTDGGHVELEDGTPHDDVPGERQWARIFEITRDNPPQRVFEIKFDSGLGNPFGWSIYRAMRIPNLYDGFRIDPPAEDENHQLIERGPHVKREG